MRNIVKIVLRFKLVLYIELQKSTKTVHVQNKNVNNFTGFLFSSNFWVVLIRETTRKTEKRVELSTD